MDRRTFLKTSAAVPAAVAIARSGARSTERSIAVILLSGSLSYCLNSFSYLPHFASSAFRGRKSVLTMRAS